MSDVDLEMRSIGELFLHAADLLRAVFTDAAAAVDLSYVEGSALRLVAKQAQQSQLLDVLSSDPSRVSAIVRRLEKKGLITRQRSDSDKRMRTIELTEAGAAAHEVIMQHLFEFSPLVRLGSDQMNSLRDMLRDMCDPATEPKPYVRECD